MKEETFINNKKHISMEKFSCNILGTTYTIVINVCYVMRRDYVKTERAGRYSDDIAGCGRNRRLAGSGQECRRITQDSSVYIVS